MVKVVMRGVFGVIWWLPVWVCFVHVGHAVGLLMKRRTSIYTVSVTIFAVVMGVPFLVAWMFRSTFWISLPARLVVAGLMPFAELWELVFSIGCWMMVAMAMHLWIVVKLRQWGGELHA